MTLAAAAHASAIHVQVVRTLDALQAVYALRAMIYMGEQNCPYVEEFDGNDLCGATHLLALIGDRPIGCCRLRWFADFAKLERVAVVKSDRGGRALKALWQAAAQMAAQKGYEAMLGHIELALMPMWRRFGGFERRPARPAFRFSDRDYVEALAPLPPANDAVRLDTNPIVVLRPEGAWDGPGVLDRSAFRNGATT